MKTKPENFNPSPYYIRMPVWQIYDRDELEVTYRSRDIKTHIKHDDYFATLATVLELSRQSIEEAITELEKVTTEQTERLERLRDDLLYLQENYAIVERTHTKEQS